MHVQSTRPRWIHVHQNAVVWLEVGVRLLEHLRLSWLHKPRESSEHQSLNGGGPGMPLSIWLWERTWRFWGLQVCLHPSLP